MAGASDFCFTPRPMRILGTGAVRPEPVPSSHFDATLGLEPGTVAEATGVSERGVFAGTSAQLGAQAAASALTAAGLELDDVDLIVAANATRDQQLPYDAALLHEELAPSHPIPAWDVGASCLSFTVAMDQLATLIAAGRYRRVLLVSTDLASVGLDWSDLGSSGIFGDGAAAVVLGPSDDSVSTVVGSGMRTWSEGAHYCEIPGGGSRYAPTRVDGDYAPQGLFRMDGGAVMSLTARKLPGFVTELLEGCQLSIDDVVVVPHQASHLGLAWLKSAVGISDERLVDIYHDHGNQVAASLPSALHAAVAAGQLTRGDHALLLGTGAGISMAGVVLCY